MQCGAERAVKDCQRSDWREMRSCHGAEQRVNNLEKSEGENLAERETAEIHRRRGNESSQTTNTSQGKSRVTRHCPYKETCCTVR